jgi:hypothetical protein
MNKFTISTEQFIRILKASLVCCSRDDFRLALN